MMSASMVNAFLAWEHELGRAEEEDDCDLAMGSRIVRFVVRVIGAILPSLQEDCPGSADQTNHPCQLETRNNWQTKNKGGQNPREILRDHECL
jgi:hypothetical protein